MEAAEFNLQFVSKKIEPDMFSDSPQVNEYPFNGDKENYFPIQTENAFILGRSEPWQDKYFTQHFCRLRKDKVEIDDSWF